LKVDEGSQYFFRDITWVGNTKYTTEQLLLLLDIKKGDVYDQTRLENRLSYEEDAVSNLYLDDGYLFFQAIPKELIIENDSVDLEIMIFEGPQARINRISVIGNSRTNDRVVIRELRTIPGELFSKSDIIRSIRELANLGSFDPEQLVPTPIPNQVDGTVDIEYSVIERSNDMFELSGGWGAGMFVGKVGLSFNNFSTHNFFDKKSWQPLPTGDGQKLSLSVQASGKAYQMVSVSFIEPWLGGKKPNSLSISLYYNSIGSYIGYGDVEPGAMRILGVATGIGKRLKWPDDYFTIYNEINLQKYILRKETSYIDAPLGDYNIISLSSTLGRSSIDNPIYSRSGSSFTLSLQSTLPYSLLGFKMSDKFNWIEFYKVTFNTSWFNQIVGDLVLHSKIEYGAVGYFDKNIGYTPFESYEVGGSGMGYGTYGKENIALRGYEDKSLTPTSLGKEGGHIYSKYTIELRYPVVLSESANIYGLGFLEAGNCWYNLNEFNPFDIYRSAGVGVRVFLPMLGQLGIDWGYGFDEVPNNAEANKGQIHFVFGQQF
jgi:outer membrane protein insertion porin family